MICLCVKWIEGDWLRIRDCCDVDIEQVGKDARPSLMSLAQEALILRPRACRAKSRPAIID